MKTLKSIDIVQLEERLEMASVDSQSCIIVLLSA